MTKLFEGTDIVRSGSGLPEDPHYHLAWRCKACNTVIISLSRHSWVACKCFKNEADNEGIFIDGGREYLRGGGKVENIEELLVKIG